MPLALGRRTASVVACALVAAAATTAATPVSGHAAAARPAALVDSAIRTTARSVAVVVQGGGAAARDAVRAVGGRVTRDLPLVGGFAAHLPGHAVHRIAEVPGVRAVTLDARMHVQGSLGSVSSLPSVYRKVVRSDDLSAAGAQGQGVTVALVDTGVSAMQDLAGRIVPVPSPLGLTTSPCVDFSGSGTCDDQYGHGTFVAGLIAGNGAASLGTYAAPAPQARILSVKIAGADGSADVSDVLAAVQWVVSTKDRFGTEVLNLSLGTDSTQSYRIDPLNYAVERAWQAGITVVVAASNRGPAPGTISKPADDPFVLTVGATDDRGTAGLGDDALPNFSSRGPTAADGLAKPDVVAPGAHLVSLAAPGATITTQFPSTMAAPYRRGSGTSFAAGVVSGVVAQLLSANPAMTPDRVKYALMATARPDATSDVTAVGAGLVDAYSAAFSAPAGLANQGVTPGSGGGSVAASRGNVQVNAAGVVTLGVGSGGVTAELSLFNPLAYVSDPWTESSWLTSQWLGNNWTGNNWTGNNWTGNNWTGNNWTGNNWTGNNWTATDWYGNNWTGSAWYGAWDQ